MRKLAGIGHSHLSCFQRAHLAPERAGAPVWAEAAFLRLNRPALQPNFETGPGRTRRLAPAAARRIAHVPRRSAPDAILLAAMGNEADGRALLRHPEPFDVAYPGEPDLDPAEAGARPPRALMDAQMQMLADRNGLLFWRHVDALAEAPVFVVPPPPPIASADHILAHPGAFGERARRHGPGGAAPQALAPRLRRDRRGDRRRGPAVVLRRSSGRDVRGRIPCPPFLAGRPVPGERGLRGGGARASRGAGRPGLAGESVIAATACSKAALRVAAEELRATLPGCAHFPSDEIVTGAHARGAHFAEDLRELRPEGVAHVMRLFMEHSTEGAAAPRARRPAAPGPGSFAAKVQRALDAICDEERIDRPRRRAAGGAAARAGRGRPPAAAAASGGGTAA